MGWLEGSDFCNRNLDLFLQAVSLIMKLSVDAHVTWLVICKKGFFIPQLKHILQWLRKSLLFFQEQEHSKNHNVSLMKFSVLQALKKIIIGRAVSSPPHPTHIINNVSSSQQRLLSSDSSNGELWNSYYYSNICDICLKLLITLDNKGRPFLKCVVSIQALPK